MSVHPSFKTSPKYIYQYAVCNQELSSLEDTYDSIAPCTQSVEYQDQALHLDFNENYNLSDNTCIPSEVQMLNKEQKEFFCHVLYLIKTSDKPFYCFLHEEAGVGM